MLERLREIAAAATALAAYLTTVLAPTRRQLRAWKQRAELIPDPVLRAAALASLSQKSLNVEAVAVFATLAPLRNRAEALGAIVALQTAIDYLDSLDEDREGSLADGITLHSSLASAVTPDAAPPDRARAQPRHVEDGGYLDALVAACRGSARALPSSAAVLPLAAVAADRCGEGQSRTHAAAGDGVEQLRDWASGLTGREWLWWEAAAGASSSVAAHVLIAAAADPSTTAETAKRIDAAYFPAIGALTVLLDDLVDIEEDTAAGEHNYVSYYAGGAEAVDRIATTADRAAQGIEALPKRRRQKAILAGVAGFYLSAPEAETPFARPIGERLIASLGPGTRLLVSFMKLRRRF